MKKYNVLSLFGCIATGLLALKLENIPVNKYYESEIDSSAITIAKKNHGDDVIHIGDVTNWREWDIDWKSIDLLIAGSPCQGFSRAGNQLNFEHKKSKLFFVFVEIMEHIKALNPEVKIFLENVSMKHEWRDIITSYMGMQPIAFNSKVISAGSRPRLYWTNIPGFKEPEDLGIMLDDIIDHTADQDETYRLRDNYFEDTKAHSFIDNGKLIWRIPENTVKGYIDVIDGQGVDLTRLKSTTRRGRNMKHKCNCLTATKYYYCVRVGDWFRLLTPKECERTLTLPDDYTAGVSDAERYRLMGNGWNLETIRLFFRGL